MNFKISDTSVHIVLVCYLGVTHFCTFYLQIMALTVQKSVVVKTERVNDLLKVDFIATLFATYILCLSLEL